jgi:hypothetical protein
LKCFHAPKAVAQQAPVPTAPGGIPIANLPGRQDGAAGQLGDRTNSNIGVAGSGAPPVSEEERAKYRKEPKGIPQATGERPPPLREAYSSTNEDGNAYSQDRLWEPPKRGELIDKLPRHPEAGRTR